MIRISSKYGYQQKCKNKGPIPELDFNELPYGWTQSSDQKEKKRNTK